LAEVTLRLQHSLTQNPRKVFVLYHNPLLERVLASSDRLRKIVGSLQYSVYESV